MVYKLKWFFSAFILSFFLKEIRFPTYFSFPIFSKGLNKVSIGRKVRVFPGSRFEVHGDGYIKIGNDVGIGQNFHITSGGCLNIGDGTVISANVFITNIDHGYEDINTPILNQDNIISETIIGNNCFIGIGAAIQAGTKLGNHCIVGTNSVVKGNFPDYSVIVGAPAKIIKKYNFETSTWDRV